MIGMPTVVQVRVLYTENCPHAPATVSLIERAAREARIPIRVEKELIQTEEQAAANRFMGSPTVQIDGLDLDPDMRHKSTFDFT